MSWFPPQRSRRTLAQPRAALIGKLPFCPDFVRESCPGPAADAFDAWLVNAAAPRSMAAARTRLELESVTFGYCVPKTARALLGVLAPSQDSAGRAFPVAVFRELDLGLWRSAPAEQLEALGAFLAAARELLRALHKLNLDELRQRLHELPEPLGCAAAARDGSGEPHVAAFLRRAFAEDLPHTDCYALTTLASACGAASDGVDIALDCPVRDELDVAVWLELVTRVSPPECGGVSFLFAPESARLLLTVGVLDPALLCVLAKPEHVCRQLWPLRTGDHEALEHARARLSPLLPELTAETSALGLHELATRLASLRER